MPTESKTGLVKNDSKAYGYNYASLSDIVKQGYTIPKMRIRPTETGDYIEYFDGENWLTGAKIVVPDMKGANEAQRYGSALTYARRYTAQMALSLACDDDQKIETAAPVAKKPSGKIDFAEVRGQIKNAKSASEVRNIYAEIPGKLQQYFEKDCVKRVNELQAHVEANA